MPVIERGSSRAYCSCYDALDCDQYVMPVMWRAPVSTTLDIERSPLFRRDLDMAPLACICPCYPRLSKPLHQYGRLTRRRLHEPLTEP